MSPKLKSFLQPLALPNNASFALLLLRVVVGLAFMFHGWGKIQTPFEWMPPEAGIPGFLQFLAAISEFGGGLSLILGLLVSVSTLGMICTMAVATHMHAIIRQDPFVGQGGPSYELALVYLIIAFAFLMIGAGKFSIDAKIFGEKKN